MLMRRHGGTALLFLAALLVPGAVSAQSGGFRAGVLVPMERVKATLAKTVDNTAANTLVPPPRRGTLVMDEGSADTWGSGVGAFLGYRAPLGGSGFHMGARVDAALHFAAVDGQLAGVGDSPGRNQLGESWPDQWTFERKRSFGLTMEIGGSPGALASMDATLFLLGGIRLAQVELTNRFDGCMLPEGCGPSDFVSGTDTRDLNHQAFTFGLGLEKGLGEGLALRVEASHTPYCDEQWTAQFTEVGVTVPTVLDAGETGLKVGVVWRGS
ncbi:MAG: hypothetical protein F4X47_10015 [Gammaproteobacteria bacterium]|nr:hypothetical protein [Gammaproteobacteria bacterium]MYC52638.1 hypothetical protein [Gammaproteobacteria bacterium]